VKFFEGMEHVETMKIHHPRCTCVEPSKWHQTVNSKYTIYKQYTMKQITAPVPNCPDISTLQHQGRQFGTEQHWTKPWQGARCACVITW